MNFLIEEALSHEQRGDHKLSHDLFEQALREYKEDPDVLYFGAIYLLNKKEYERALDVFVTCYNLPGQSYEIKSEVFQQLMAAYYEPNKTGYLQNYSENCIALTGYVHNFLDELIPFDKIPYLFITRNNREFYIFEKSTQLFLHKILLQDNNFSVDNIGHNSSLLSIDIYNIDNLKDMDTKLPFNPHHWARLAIYIVWQDQIKTILCLQAFSYVELINKNRFVFFAGIDERFNKFFNDPQILGQTIAQIVGPNNFVGTQEKCRAVINQFQHIVLKKNRKGESHRLRALQTMKKYTSKYYRDIFNGNKEKIRLLFLTSRSSAVMQYNTYDCIAACEKIGVICDLLVEKSNIHQNTSEAFLAKIVDFQPNIIFEISGYRYNNDYIPKEILWITWLQDYIPENFSKKNIQRLETRDYILACMEDYTERLIKAGLNPAKLMHQYNPYNPDLYYPRQVSEDDEIKYSADISFMGHVCRPDLKMAEFMHKTMAENPMVKQQAMSVLLSAYENAWSRSERGESLYTIQDCLTLLNDLGQPYGFSFESEFAENFFINIVTQIEKKIRLLWIADWLKERDYTLKLWGKEWHTDLSLKNYATGTVEQGEEKAKAFSCTKILIANLSYSTTHFRAFEATACGALCLIRHIPEQYDHENIRKYWTEGEDFIFFYDKLDLYNKLDYYLTNEDERRRIVENGKKKIMENMTYTMMMEKVLTFVGNDIVG